MSATGRMWADEHQRICDLYYEFQIGRTEANERLLGLGIDDNAACDELDEIDHEHLRDAPFN